MTQLMNTFAQMGWNQQLVRVTGVITSISGFHNTTYNWYLEDHPNLTYLPPDMRPNDNDEGLLTIGFL